MALSSSIFAIYIPSLEFMTRNKHSFKFFQILIIFLTDSDNKKAEVILILISFF